MMRSFKSFLSLSVLLAVGPMSSFGFSLAGPTNSEPWQTTTIGYQLTRYGDLVTPKNLGEEYRRNYPVIYYYIDQNFRDYFGSNGVAAIESAISIFNNLTNVSSYSSNLLEFPTQATRENYRAEALSLTDLKSFTLPLLCEQLGLAAPERYVWCLHDREHFGPVACPVGEEYTLVQRNFDPVPSPLNQFQSSSYVNGTLYSYTIFEDCDVSPPAPPSAIAVAFQVDPLDTGFTSIAGGIDAFTGLATSTGPSTGFLLPGRFWTGLTRDDVGGLRYLLRAKNINYESAGTNTISYITNDAPQLLVTSNLTLFADQALTNNAATLSGLYPGLAILSSIPIFTNIYTTNLTPFFTNYPYDPVGTAPHLVFSTNVTANVATYYKHTFGNLFTVNYGANGWFLAPLYTVPSPKSGVPVTIQTTTIGFTNSPYFPVGGSGTNATGTNVVLVSTNTVYQTYTTNDYTGDFVLLPPGLCSVQILFSQLTNVLSFTNQLAAVTNIVTTNSVGGVFSFSQNIITYFTNHVFVINPVLCTSNAIGWREGIERITFVRIPDNAIDEFTYSLYNPLTNNYTVVTYDPTNNVYVSQRNQRLVSTPDLLFSAQDLMGVPGNAAIEGADVARNIAFSPSTGLGLAYQGLAGPGTIVLPAPPVLNAFIYNKSGPYYGNLYPDSATLQAEAFQIPLAIWGSFDATTNDPVVYPNGTSIASLESRALIHVLPLTLPNGNVYIDYPATTFTATGGQPPYIWSLAPGSPLPPPGLTLTPDGTVSGTPTQDGTFDFVVRLTDAAGHVVDYNYSITINL